jgi:hypothetical protein
MNGAGLASAIEKDLWHKSNLVKFTSAIARVGSSKRFLQRESHLVAEERKIATLGQEQSGVSDSREHENLKESCLAA